MNDISPIGRPSRSVVYTEPFARNQPAPQAAATRGDKVELSQHAQLLSKLADIPAVRQDVVDRVKAQIAAGTYDTPEKLDFALERLVGRAVQPERRNGLPRPRTLRSRRLSGRG